MSYSSRRRYTNRRERATIVTKNLKRALIIGSLALMVYIYKNWASISDYLMSYFY